MCDTRSVISFFSMSLRFWKDDMDITRKFAAFSKSSFVGRSAAILSALA